MYDNDEINDFVHIIVTQDMTEIRCSNRRQIQYKLDRQTNKQPNHIVVAKQMDANCGHCKHIIYKYRNKRRQCHVYHF